MDRLKNQVTLITGAGSGMGQVVATMFAKEGAQVIALDTQEAGLQETEKLIRDADGDVLTLVTDVTQDNAVREAVEAGMKRFGKITVLYNNAGIMPEADHSVTDTEPDVWDRVQAVNLKGVYLVCKYGIPALIEAGGGSVINIASFVASVGCTVPQDSYTASKGAVLALTKSLAAQFGPKGVRANAISPGPIETPLLMEWLLTDPAAKALRLARIPMGRFGKPEDIGHLAVYLASPESSWMTGSELNIDGGITSFYF
ncbi:MAG: short-chain dehydrogenase [Sulfobacillus benefaciens]|uniref:Short-chain dehydrogenase n=1 Tax=Sulfobacillus benefaciens TaxID=453960 RepID=A0A2T2XHX1_9FIRM|nr:MAG: short-chain dehydrogenase [Sulfobacillus benefaciens]